MNFERILRQFKLEGVVGETFTKDSGVLVGSSWDFVQSFLGSSTLSLVISDDLADFGVIRENVSPDKLVLLCDDGETKFFGLEFEGVRFVVGLGPVDCLFVAEKNSFVLGSWA